MINIWDNAARAQGTVGNTPDMNELVDALGMYVSPSSDQNKDGVDWGTASAIGAGVVAGGAAATREVIAQRKSHAIRTKLLSENDASSFCSNASSAEDYAVYEAKKQEYDTKRKIKEQLTEYETADPERKKALAEELKKLGVNENDFRNKRARSEYLKKIEGSITSLEGEIAGLEKSPLKRVIQVQGDREVELIKEAYRRRLATAGLEKKDLDSLINECVKVKRSPVGYLDVTLIERGVGDSRVLSDIDAIFELNPTKVRDVKVYSHKNSRGINRVTGRARVGGVAKSVGIVGGSIVGVYALSDVGMELYNHWFANENKASQVDGQDVDVGTSSDPTLSNDNKTKIEKVLEKSAADLGLSGDAAVKYEAFKKDFKENRHNGKNAQQIRRALINYHGNNLTVNDHVNVSEILKGFSTEVGTTDPNPHLKTESKDRGMA